MEGQLRAFSNDGNLRRFVVQATPTGRHLGTGSYGSVEEVDVNGQVCAGKKIHEVLLDVGNIGVQEFVEKYVQECQTMSDLRHPNIALFMGVCFLPNYQLPVLVMERLDGSLDDLLETVPNIPLTLKRSILEDIARGLLYLHKRDRPIIHRDLTAKNVLLTSSLMAKITDFGNSCVVNIHPSELAQTLSRNPGTLVYMPPEAQTGPARYHSSLDIFSFGHLGLFVGVQVFPGDLLEPTYAATDNSDNLKARSEVERRGHYLEQLERMLPDGGNHPLVQMVKACLKNGPSERPTAEELITSLEEMKADIEGPYGDVARAGAVREVVMMRALRKRETEAERTRGENQLQQARTQLLHKDILIRWKDDELRQTRSQLQEYVRQLEQQTAQLNTVQHNFQRLRADLEQREAQLRAQEEEMQRQDAEINRLMGELRSCQAQLPRQQEGGSNAAEERQAKDQQIKQTTLAKLQIPLKLTWKRVKDMPFCMTSHDSSAIQAVVIDNSVYVGGGYMHFVFREEINVVMVYSLLNRSWAKLPPYESQFFGMATVNDQLVVVGGRVSTSIGGGSTNVLGVWNKGWTHPLPVMPTARYSPSVISYQQWVVVAGGRDERSFHYSTVELLDTCSRRWYEGSPLPSGCSGMSAAIIGNVWYLSGGYSSQGENRHVFSVCLDELISQAVSQSTGAPSPWQTLPETPLVHSALLILNGALLAVGGFKSSAIHIYQPTSKSWVKVGYLPTQRWHCACTVLPNGEIFVAGGHDVSFLGNLILDSTDRVDIASIVQNNVK